MSDFYCDVSAIGNEYQVYADTPTTWGVPQDGNGKAGPGHTATVAIATIDVAGCTASGTGTIGVFGINVSTTLNASDSALATAIVAAINAATGPVTATYSALLLPLNKLVFARVNPGLSTQVQIMLRIAGVDWVGLSPTQANISPAATISNFAGGANGPFGYLWSLTASVFGKTVLAYGIAPAKSPAVTEPGIIDTIHVRTKRAGTNITLEYTMSTLIGISVCPSGSTRSYVFDDGTVWAGDNGQLSIAINSTHNSGANVFYGAGQFRLAARKAYGFRLAYTSTQNQIITIGSSASAGDAELSGVLFEELNSGVSSAGILVAGQSSTFSFISFDACKFTQRAGRVQVGNNASGGIAWYRYIDCEWDYYNLAAAPTGIISVAGSFPVRAEFINCRFIDRGGVYLLVNPISLMSTSSNNRILFENCSGLSPFGAAMATDAAQPSRLVQFSLPGAGRQFQTESYMATVGWAAGESIPTLTEKLPDGVTPWALRCVLRDAPDASANRVLAEITRLGLYVRASGVATYTVQLLIPTAVAFLKSRLGVLLSYVDTNDVIRHEKTLLGLHDVTTGLDASSAVWTMNGATGLTAKKLSVTTAYAVKAGTVVDAIVVHRGRIPGGVNQNIIINPALDVT